MHDLLHIMSFAEKAQIVIGGITGKDHQRVSVVHLSKNVLSSLHNQYKPQAIQ